MLAQQDNQEPYLVQQLIETFIKKGNLPGVSIAVSKNEKIIYAKGFGYADIDLKKPMTPQSQLRTASVAKVITTTALGRLISEGRIDIDMPIKTYVPYIQKNYEHLTIRQLTGHTSGLAHRPKGKKYKKKQYTSVKETVNLMKAPLLFVPDTQYQYSTHAFNLVAAAIEGASGKSFETYLKEDVFTALDMQQTFAEDIRQLSTIDATLYYLKKEKLLKEKLTNASYKLAGAGFRSTPTDLLKMMHGYTNNFIALDTRKTLFDSHTLKDGTKTQVGITWRTSFDAFGNKVIEHAGSWRGTRTVIVHYPEDNLNIVIMINADCPVFIEETAHIIAQLFRDIPKKGPTVFCKKENIKVLVNMNGVEKQLEGNLRMEGSHGMLDIQNAHPIVLAGTPIIYLGYGTHYTAITANGLLYLQMGSTSVIQGRLFLYNTRNKTYPTTHTPFATFMLDPS
jgi:CubicO group peptidase (beta-lactamase class C family)